MKRILLFIVGCLILTGCSSEPAPFPSKPISIVVPWAAGGGTDRLARLIAQEASTVFNVPVNVINQVGGSGVMGHAQGINARPDGYTVTMVTYELCGYKALKRAQIDDTDFKALMQLNQDPGAITVHSDSPWKTLKEFLDYARENPKKVTMGNSGLGAVWHLGSVKLENLSNTQFTHIPFDGAKPAITQLIGKHIDAVPVSPTEALQDIQLGTLRCLGIMSEERDPFLPDITTLKEQGYDLVHATWRGLCVPKNTPDVIAASLEEGFHKAFESPTFQEAAKKRLIGLKYRNSKEFAAFMRQESESIAALIQELGL